MPYTTLLTAQDADGIVVATINRPDKLNALNDAVITDLAALAAWAAEDASVRALVLTGAGEKAFVAGADIAEIAGTDATSGERLSAKGHAAFRALETLGKPVIAAVNGFALGGGCELAMACHIRYASPNAKFGQPEVKLGLIPPTRKSKTRSTPIEASTALEAICDRRPTIAALNTSPECTMIRFAAVPI